MKKGKVIFGLVFIVLCLLFFGTCAGEKTDPGLNGTWVRTSPAGYEMEIKLNNGKYEEKFDDISIARGTFSTNDGEYIPVRTHIFGGFWSVGLAVGALESKWYSVDEFISIAYKTGFFESYMSESEIDEFLASISSLPKASYSVDANSLILKYEYEDDDEEDIVIYNRK